MVKSGTPFYPSGNQFFHILIAAIFLFGLLIVLAMAQADGTIADQVTDNDTGEFICGTHIPVSEASIQRPTWTDNTHAGSGYNISVPEGTVTDDATQNIVQGADVQTYKLETRGVKYSSVPADASGYYSVTVHPETGYTIDGNKDGYNNAATESTAANIGPTYHESELPQASSTTDEFGLGYQQGSYHEYNEGSISHIEYRHMVHYVDREVVKEVLVEKPVELRQFTSLEELEAWLAKDDTDEYVYLFASKDGVCRPSERYDCDDYAFQLQHRAANSGFLISVTIIKKQGKSHMINLACIHDNIYYIEPQSDKVWFYCNRD